MPFVSDFLLSLLQGLTEFLPISSSGHLVITADLLGYQSPGLVLEVAVHVATTLAVIIYFRERFISIIRGAFNDLRTRHLVLILALSFTVTPVVGLLLSP
jgi:undecaprenyl-diphosphatase